MKSVPSESELHASVAEFLDWALLPPTVWTTFPAGWGKLGRATAGKLKRAGLKEGMPDILIFFNGRTYGIELKVGRNKQGAAQEHMQLLLAGAGVPMFICRSVDDVQHVLKSMDLPIRKMELQNGTQRQAARPQNGAGASIA